MHHSKSEISNPDLTFLGDVEGGSFHLDEEVTPEVSFNMSTNPLIMHDQSSDDSICLCLF